MSECIICSTCGIDTALNTKIMDDSEAHNYVKTLPKCPCCNVIYVSYNMLDDLMYSVSRTDRKSRLLHNVVCILFSSYSSTHTFNIKRWINGLQILSNLYDRYLMNKREVTILIDNKKSISLVNHAELIAKGLGFLDRPLSREAIKERTRSTVAFANNISNPNKIDLQLAWYKSRFNSAMAEFNKKSGPNKDKLFRMVRPNMPDFISALVQAKPDVVDSVIRWFDKEMAVEDGYKCNKYKDNITIPSTTCFCHMTRFAKTDSEGNNPIHIMVKKKALIWVNVLTKYFDIDHQNNEGNTPLHWAAKTFNKKELTTFLTFNPKMLENKAGLLPIGKSKVSQELLEAL